MRRQKQIRQAHEVVAVVLGVGDIAVDATAGNGYDTAFLAASVGESGHVYAFDVQPRALQNTAARLEGAGQMSRVRLIEAGHEEMAARIPVRHHGRIRAVMFNLGYLPGSDRQCITRPQTTTAALDAALALLAPDGVITVVAYAGHPGGQAEADAVRDWCARQHGCQIRHNPGDSSTAPELFVIRTGLA